MKPPNAPLFLERRSYRRRRLIDMARLLPVLACFLWMIPLLWSSGEGTARTGRAMLYIFSIWIVVIAISAFLSRRLARTEAEDPAQNGAYSQGPLIETIPPADPSIGR
ncbi:MAG: hypothetical protein ACJA06_001606 [Halocynthiibacter sp.]|jgi:hypothetical protein